MKRTAMPGRRCPLPRGSGSLRRAVKPLPTVSRKRAAQTRTYTKLRAVFLEEHPRCEWPAGCVWPATEVHHKRGRVGSAYLDTAHWSALCHSHHAFITANPRIAYDMGLSEHRIGAA